MNNNDRCIGQLEVRVHLLNDGIIPFFDLGHVDIGDDFARQLQLARLDAVDVDDRNRSTHDGGKLEQIVFGECVTLHGVIGSRSEEHTSELQSLMRIAYAVFSLQKKK